MRIGAVVIGQTPRPDLLAVLGGGEIDLRGALDLPGALPIQEDETTVFPLTTRLADGTNVLVDEPWLAPLVQKQIRNLESAGADVIVLMCAGPFAGLVADRPLVHPFRLGIEVLRAMGAKQLLALVPFEAQRVPAERKWREAGFQVKAAVFTAGPELVEMVAALAEGADAIVFDYVGLAEESLSAIRGRIGVPVLDLGHLAAAALRALTRP
ncbi:MAG: protein AroM [Rhodothermales bacterium]|jgi:protein AroM